MAPSAPPIPRPQMIRCLCGLSSYDGFAIMCDKCARWCHAACFDIATRADVPKDWKCWVCFPRSGINKLRAVVLQTARQVRFETDLRDRQLGALALVPDLGIMSSIVADSFQKLDRVMVSPEECKRLVTQCLILLLVIHGTPTPLVDQYTGILSLLRRINDDLTEWGELTTVKALIRKSEINNKIEASRESVSQFIAFFAPTATKLQLTDFPEIIPPDTKENESQTAANASEASSPTIPPPIYEQMPHATKDVSSPESTRSQSPDNSVSENGVPHYQNGLYENLSNLVHQEMSASTTWCRRETDHIHETIRATSESFTKLNIFLALSRSHQYRAKLTEICSDLGILESPRVREALEADENHIFSVLQQIFSDPVLPQKEVVLELQETDAENFMDLLQMALDKYHTEDLKFWHGARRLLVKLSEASGVLPTSLTIRGVTLLEKEAIFGGGFADIYRASYDKKEVALKRMRVFQRGQERHRIHRTFCKEALVWKSLRHPHVLPFLGIDSTTFSPYLCMVSPWMRHGTIIRHLSDNKGVDLNKLLNEVAQGLNYLHSQNVVHGDLRGGNILINDQWQACLADFGLTVMSEATLATHTSNSHGSTRWMAPELHDPESFGLDRFLRTSASDIYAFGCVCLEVYTGRAPFMNITNDTTVMLQVVRGVRPQRPPFGPGWPLSDDVWDMITQCWKQNPAERLDIRKIVDITESWRPPSQYTH